MVNKKVQKETKTRKSGNIEKLPRQPACSYSLPTQILDPRDEHSPGLMGKFLSYFLLCSRFRPSSLLVMNNNFKRGFKKQHVRPVVVEGNFLIFIFEYYY